MSATSSGVLVALALWSVGCSQKERSRPPYAELSCDGMGCGDQGGVGAPGGSPVTPGNGAVTDDGSSEGRSSSEDSRADDAGTQTVLLDPQEATDLQRTFGAPIGLPYALYAWPEVATPLLRSTGAAPETLNVDANGQWFLVMVTDAAEVANPTWLSTLSWQRPSLEAVAVPIYRAQFWTDLAAGLALSPTTLDPDASQVVVQVIGSNGEPVLGVSGEVVSGALAYGNGGSASDVLTETDDSGLMVWINAPAGEGTTLTLRTDNALWSVVIPTRASTVTVTAVADQP